MLLQNENRMISFFRLIRSNNLAIIAITQFFTAYFLIPDTELIINNIGLYSLILSTVLIAAAGYIINDYYDIKIDTINKYDKVIIGRVITRRSAIILHSLLNFTGIALGLLASNEVAIIATISSFLLWLYSNQLKRLPVSGNFLVSLLTALSVSLVGIYYKNLSSTILLYSLFAFFISFIREIIKDIQDLKGDQTFGCKTLPIVLGIRKTKWVLFVIQGFFLVSLGFTSFFLPPVLLYYFLLFIIPSLIYLNFKLTTADTSKDFKFLSNWCKLIMLIGMISMLFI